MVKEYMCPICNKLFIQRGKTKRRTCSRKCYAISMIGTKRPPEVCKMISLHHSRHNKGKKHSPEHIKRMSESRKGKYMGRQHPNWIERETRECHVCEKPFITYITSTKKFCSHKCYWTNNIKGRKIDYFGYIWLYKPNHPNADRSGYVAEHRLIAESILKRYLTSNETIHHIDKNPQNNNPSNLYLFPTKKAHNIYHIKLRLHPEIKITKSNL